MRKLKTQSHPSNALKKGSAVFATTLALALPSHTLHASPPDQNQTSSAPDTMQTTQAKPQQDNLLQQPNTRDTLTALWQPFTATYEIRSSKVPFTGRVERSLNQSPEGHWVASSKAKAFASKVQETSHFMITDGCQVKSTAFSYKRKVFGKTKDWSITMDWPEKQIHYKTKKQTQTLSLTTDTLADRLSEQFSVRCFVSMGAEAFTINTIRRDQLKTQSFKRMGQETLDTALGTLEAIKVEKEHDSDKRKTTLWFSPEHNYRLIKLIQQDDDETLTIDVKALP